ncbi:monooxygenase [Paramyrothecium foliicola]|nr:monooxygenase [Paramyrothecium foliicola]
MVDLIQTQAAVADDAVSSASISPGSHPYSIMDTGQDGLEKIQQKYDAERQKRLRPDGLDQYVKLGSATDQKLRHYLEDPWDDGSSPSLPLKDGIHSRFIIVGAGFGGLQLAVRLLEAGCLRDDIILVDQAAGFGGAWYWNRYPGLTCDIDSSIYMPLLEETGYVPRHKYAYGEELREYANRIAGHWDLTGRAMLRTELRSCQWKDGESRWSLDLIQRPRGSSAVTAKLSTEFVIMMPGLFDRPKLPDLPGLGSFLGKSFLTSRWDYETTGGSQEDPNFSNLGDKKVGIIGTGATALQVVPHLAKWSKHLFVFQRTPASVDVRGQRPIEPEEWTEITRDGPGWQAIRSRNFLSFTTHKEPLPAVDMISDGWTDFPSYHILTGGGEPVTADMVGAHVARAHILDLPRAERVRARVDELVHDPTVAAKLKPWYPGWCKRPGFHDDYLPSFNRANVTLVDTAGRGVQRIGEAGVMANSQWYDLDILIFSTGFEASYHEDPGSRCGVAVLGRGGRKMSDKWAAEGTATLHGVLSRGFPNLFFTGTPQAGVSPNYMPSLDTFARHIAFIISHALERKDKDGTARVTVEPTAEAEKDWVMRVLGGAYALAPLASCTPSYFNGETNTAELPMEDQIKAVAMAAWPGGLIDYMDVLKAWRDSGKLEGLCISSQRGQ